MALSKPDKFVTKEEARVKAREFLVGLLNLHKALPDTCIVHCGETLCEVSCAWAHKQQVLVGMTVIITDANGGVLLATKQFQ